MLTCSLPVIPPLAVECFEAAHALRRWTSLCWTKSKNIRGNWLSRSRAKGSSAFLVRVALHVAWMSLFLRSLRATGARASSLLRWKNFVYVLTLLRITNAARSWLITEPNQLFSPLISLLFRSISRHWKMSANLTKVNSRICASILLPQDSSLVKRMMFLLMIRTLHSFAMSATDRPMRVILMTCTMKLMRCVVLQQSVRLSKRRWPMWSSKTNWF